MRFLTLLVLLPLIGGLPERAIIAQTAPATAPSSAVTEATSTTVRWNRLAPRFVEEAAVARRTARTAAAGDSAALRQIAQKQPPMPFMVYTLLSVAQHAAVNSAKQNSSVSPEVAVAAASAAILSEMFSDSTVRASIAKELARDFEKARAKSGAAERATAGQRLGDDVARRVIAWAPDIQFVGPWNGTIPTGPGMWYSARGLPPIGITLAKARGWLLDSASQFRPAPPLTFGSPAFQAALEEVRQVTRKRTPEQTRIAQRWNEGDPWALWNETAVAALNRHRMSDAQAAQVLAVLNVAASDAIIACFEAKYHYWTIRPSQVDSTLALADSVSLPNFPSYPSGHACSAGAFDAVLGHFFPRQRAEFTAIAEEQAMSRLYGGVHYRFDNDVGLALGRVVGRHVVDRERRGGLNAWRNPANTRKP